MARVSSTLVSLEAPWRAASAFSTPLNQRFGSTGVNFGAMSPLARFKRLLEATKHRVRSSWSTFGAGAVAVAGAETTEASLSLARSRLSAMAHAPRSKEPIGLVRRRIRKSIYIYIYIYLFIYIYIYL